MRVSKQEKQEALDHLRNVVKAGSTVHTILRHCSRSGMSRAISLVVIDGDESYQIDGWASKVTGYPRNQKHDGLTIGGCGMDMGFQLVYQLSHYLFPDGFECTGEKCPSNDHSNGDRDYTPHKHGDGGYAIRQRWL